MPNWVRQRVVARNPQELKKHLINEKGEVDFNMIIPMPQDLRITAGSYSYATPSKYFTSKSEEVILKRQKETVDVEFAKIYNDTITQQEFFEEVMKHEDILKLIRNVKDWHIRKSKAHPYAMGKEALKEGYETYIKGYFNIQRYGERDWYEWSISNWGTKWNASDSCFDEETGVAEFETAWSMPEPVYRALSQYTPLRVVYADEDLGANCGMEDYFYDEDGSQLQVVMEGSVELANDTWGYGSISVYDEETGEFIEDEDNPKVIEANKNYFQTQQEINDLMNPDTIKKDFAEV
jgi:hypothetical protein